MKKIGIVLLIIFALGACGAIMSDSTEPTQSPSESIGVKDESKSDKNTPKPTLTTTPEPTPTPTPSPVQFTLADVPDYDGNAYVAINNNDPFFTSDIDGTVSFEEYSPLDSLGRCGVAFASVGTDIMPTENRGSIGSVKPSGWQTVRYDNVVDGNYLYNRCHLLGWQLTGENANEQNLITGTRYLNIEGMLPFENMVADYVKETNNHVLYRVTPIFDGDNLVANGVLMEGYSVEDSGAGISFCAYAYNVQPHIEIDYATGNSSLEAGYVLPTPEPTPTPTPEPTPEPTPTPKPAGTRYIINTNTGKFHYPSCGSVKQMKESNKWDYTGNRNDIIDMGYVPCKKCNP